MRPEDAKTRESLAMQALRVFAMVGLNGLEPSTSTMSTWHSNQLSYNPEQTIVYTIPAQNAS